MNALPPLCFALQLQPKMQFILNEVVKLSHTGNPFSLLNFSDLFVSVCQRV